MGKKKKKKTHKERSRRVGKEIQNARRKVKPEWKRGREGVGVNARGESGAGGFIEKKKKKASAGQLKGQGELCATFGARG